ncbi:MAG: hypothetical protein WC076_02465 [Terrimicrobiaceae bacterium]
MPHDVSHPPAKFRKAPFFALAMVLLLLFLGANIWLTGWRAGDADPEEVERAEFRAKTLAELQAGNDKKLGSYAWIDRAKGTVQIPIAEAMKLVLPEINATQPHAAYPVDTPAAPTPNRP